MTDTPRSPMTLVPLTALGSDVKGLQSPSAFVGPLAPETGQPLCAFSEISLDGYAIDPLAPRASGARQWATTLKTASAIGLVFGGLLGGLLVLIAQDTTSYFIMAGLVVGLFGLFTFLFRPKRQGWSAIVGTRALQYGTVNDGVLDRTMFPFDDWADAWFEEGKSIFTRRPGWPVGPTPTTVEMRVTIRERSRLEQLAVMGFVWAYQDAKNGRAGHRPNLYFALVEHGYSRRIADARARLERGEAIELPTLDGASVRILPTQSGGRATFGVELSPRGSGKLTIDAPIALSQGVYTMTSGGSATRVERAKLGDAFVLDALCIGSGAATDTDAMAHEEMAGR